MMASGLWRPLSSLWHRYQYGLTGNWTSMDMLLVAHTPFVPVLAIDVPDTRPSRDTHEGIGGSSFPAQILASRPFALCSTTASASLTR